MDSLPPFQVRVDTRARSCILDVRLALASLGPLLALRLAEELPVCLVPTLWQILDNTAYFDQDPQALYDDPLVSDGYPEGLVGRRALAQWERARSDPGLSAQGIYWAADALPQSSLPQEVDARVVRRLDGFAQALKRRFQEGRPDLKEALLAPLLDGGIETLALAAAMTRYRPLILTLAVPGSPEPPPLCRLLGLCQIPVRPLGADQAEAVRKVFTPLLTRTGVLDLLWAGLPLVLVHLVVPAGLDLAPAEENGDHESLDDSLDGPQDPWEGATALWWCPLP